MLENVRGETMRYVQRPGVIAEIGHHVAPLGKRALVVANDRFIDSLVPQIVAALAARGVAAQACRFKGEVSEAEIARVVASADMMSADIVIGLGGGKAIDAAKIAAFEISAAIVTVPTIASTAAPTSSVAAINRPDGSHERILRCGHPDLVLVDSGLIARAPARWLAAGMGSVLAAIVEIELSTAALARGGVAGDRHAVSTGLATARTWRTMLLREGRAAMAAISAGRLTGAVETIIEANLLLGGPATPGVALARGIPDAMADFGSIRAFHNGEILGFGALCLMMIAERPAAEIGETLDFCIDLGLPTTLADLGIAALAADSLAEIGAAAMRPTNALHALPMQLTPGLVAEAIATTSAMAEARRRRAA